jgi:hypothetical protein
MLGREEGVRMKSRYDKRDANELPIIQHARRLGAQWRQAPPLDGWVWIARQNRWMPVEIKLPEREGAAWEYTPAQKRFFSFCREYSAPWFVWRTSEDVERDLGARRVA